MCDIIQYLSFLFHLAEYPPSPSLLLQRTSLRSFLWLSSIPLCTYVPYLLYPFSTWGLRPFPCLACCESGCSDHHCSDLLQHEFDWTMSLVCLLWFLMPPRITRALSRPPAFTAGCSHAQRLGIMGQDLPFLSRHRLLFSRPQHFVLSALHSAPPSSWGSRLSCKTSTLGTAFLGCAGQ